MAMSRPTEYVNTDHQQAEPDTLDTLLHNAAHGIKTDPMLAAFKAEFEGTNPPESLAAAEDQFRAETDTFN